VVQEAVQEGRRGDGPGGEKSPKIARLSPGSALKAAIASGCILGGCPLQAPFEREIIAGLWLGTKIDAVAGIDEGAEDRPLARLDTVAAGAVGDGAVGRRHRSQQAFQVLLGAYQEVAGQTVDLVLVPKIAKQKVFGIEAPTRAVARGVQPAPRTARNPPSTVPIRQRRAGANTPLDVAAANLFSSVLGGGLSS
jgi:hypothetical protein